MSKRGIYRSDIYWCDMRSVGIEIDHPVLIVSNWKGNIKSKYITCLRLTSKEKLNYSATHFELDVKKYGFSKDYSCVLAEEIYTLDKKFLKEKICKLEPLDALECDKLLQQHLQLTQDYQYLTHEDILNKFSEENCSITEDELLKLKCECYNLYKDNRYNESIDKCNELLEATKQAKSGKNEYSRYAHYIISMNFMKSNNNYEKALEHINQALVLIEKKNGYDYSFSIMLWNKAKCLENLKYNEEASKLYESLSNYYYRYGFQVLSLVCRFNSCKVINDIEAMVYIKEELEDLKVITLGTYETEEYRLAMLEEMNKEINSIKELI